MSLTNAAQIEMQKIVAKRGNKMYLKPGNWQENINGKLSRAASEN
jgi:hypothetical protein